MNSDKQLIQQIELENGLRLEIIDRSRKVAGDRWLVSIRARVEVTLDRLKEESCAEKGVTLEEVREHLGKKVVFEKDRERNFIDENQKDTITRELCDSILSNLKPYLEHPDFARGLIFKQYAEAVEKKSWSNQP